MPITPVQEKLKALFIAYAKSLPGKIDAIEKKWLDLCANWDHKEFENFHRDIHSLCGSAGTYGYTALGKAARQLEIYLKSLLENSALSKKQQKEITTFLAVIKQASTTVDLVDFSTADEALESANTNIVYVVDDDESFYKKINKIVESNYIFIQIKDLALLRAEIEKNKPVALIVNIDFIDNHIEFMQVIQRNQSTPLPLFCISSKNDLLTRLHAIRIGNNFFMQKPIDEFSLKKILDQLCGVTSDQPYRILIIDDSLLLAEYYALILQEVGMKTHFITNPLLLIKAIDDFQPDLLLMDIYMPECTGLELAAVLRQDEKFTKLPIIFLSTEDDRLKQLSALNLGGDDFLTKPIVPAHLIEAVKSRAKRASIITSMMTRDSLTGLFNHTAILQRLEVEVARAKRQAEPLCFIMIDIDHFKRVNDEHGHPVGDKVLKSLSNLLFTSLRKEDVTGRYGGEEFAVILPNTGKEQGLKICNTIREKFSQTVFKLNGVDFTVTFSAGISSFPNVKDAKNLIILADKALYAAKHDGRNRVSEIIL